MQKDFASSNHQAISASLVTDGNGELKSDRAGSLQAFLDNHPLSYPTPREFAHGKAHEFLQKTLKQDHDPDDLLITTLYIDGRPVGDHQANIAYSMTLTDALICNWQQEGNGSYFSHLGELMPYRPDSYPVQISNAPLPPGNCFAYEAIYRKTTPQRFDEHTQIALDPKVFKRFIWDENLQTLYLEQLKQLEAQYGDQYQYLIKAALLKSAYVQAKEGSLARKTSARYWPPLA